MTQTTKITIEQINSDGAVWRRYDHWVPVDGVEPFLRRKTLAYDMTATQFRVDGKLVTELNGTRL